MTDPVASFFGPAQRLSLTNDERAATQKTLESRVRERPADRLHGSMQQPETLFNGVRDLRLSEAEKREGLAQLRVRMAQLPPRTSNGVDAFSWLRTITSAVAGLATMTAVFGGVALAAEGALPGDALYPVKIAMNETLIVGYFRVTGDTESATTVLLARRMREAVTLADRGDRNGALAHLRRTDGAALTLAAEHPGLPLLSERTALEQHLGDTAIALFEEPSQAMTMQATDAPSAATSFAFDAAENIAPTAGNARTTADAEPLPIEPPKATEVLVEMTTDAADVEPMAMMARKALAPLLPTAGTGSSSTGSGATSSSSASAAASSQTPGIGGNLPRPH